MTKAETPIKIGKFTLKNRITFAPTVKFDFTDASGKVTPKLVEHYRERAEGGCGLICVEATAVLPGGRFGPNHMGLWDDEQTEGHKLITEACHKNGAVVIIQLNHTGYTSNPECGEPIGPSELKLKGFNGEYTTKEMSIEDIHSVQKAYTDAAIRAKRAGYDGIQLHACHGYLINQFASPEGNKRTDEYGGPAKNRARFGSEIISSIRRACGDDFLISARTTGYDSSVGDALTIAEEYVKAGCDYLQVSTGMTSLDSLEEYRSEKDPEHLIDKVESLGIRFKEHFGGRIPVSCVGGIKSPKQVKLLIENDFIDTVDVARALLADPGFADAVLYDNEYTACFGCKICQFGPFTGHMCPAEVLRKRKGGAE